MRYALAALALLYAAYRTARASVSRLLDTCPSNWGGAR